MLMNVTSKHSLWSQTQQEISMTQFNTNVMHRKLGKCSLYDEIIVLY